MQSALTLSRLRRKATVPAVRDAMAAAAGEPVVLVLAPVIGED
jgi:hypothetical protein